MSRQSVHAGVYFGLGREPGPLSDGKLLPWIKVKRAVIAQGDTLYEVLCDVADDKNTDGPAFVRYCIRRGWLE